MVVSSCPRSAASIVDPDEVAAEVEAMDADEAIAWAIETFHPALKFATSFQKTSSVTIDIAHGIKPDARFFYLDTELLFPETYETRDRLADHFGIEFERFAGIALVANRPNSTALTSGAAIRTPAAGSARLRRCARPSMGPSAGSQESAEPTPKLAPAPRSSAGTSDLACGS